MARKSPLFAAGVVICGLLCSPQTAVAQLTPSGASFLVAGVGVRGTASAYDPQNNRFLAVAAYGAVTGRLIKADGTFATDPFQIDLVTTFAHYPSVAYSPHVDAGRGGFLVTWHQNIGVAGNRVHARLISAAGVPLGAPVLLGTEATWWESSASVDYSTGSQVFLVAWRIGAYQIRASRVNIAGENVDAGSNPGTPLAGAGLLVTTTGGERDPSVAYNPDTDSFLVAYSDFLGGSHVYARLVSAATGAVAAPQLLGAGTSVYITDATFSTSARKFLVGWYQLPGGATGRVVNADGTASGTPVPLSSRFGTYDSFGIAHNPLTHSALMVGQDVLSAENGGVEISDGGLPGSTGVLTNAGGPTGNFYPQVSASTAEGRWLLTTAHNFTSVVAQFAVAPAVGPPPPPPPPQPPSVTTHPVHAFAKQNDVVTFAAAASGNPKPSVQWQVKARGSASFSDISGATGATFMVLVKQTDAGKQYRAVFTNASGSVASNAAALFVAPPARNDFDGDGKSDALVWRRSTGTWFWATSSQTNATAPVKQWGISGDVSLTGDFDGDAVADLVIWRPATGTWHWLTSSNGYNDANQGSLQWGVNGDVPIVADMDGDGLSDFVVWRPSTGNWMWLTSSSGFNLAEQGSVRWGTAGDVPLTGDFDGDGKADLAIWRPWEGMWYYLTSSTGYDYGSQKLKLWGAPGLGDRPFVGDFDGDRIADFAIWRASNGTWYWLMSSTGYSYQFARGIQWGNATYGDVPLLNDFDGDGRSDLVVWRESTGVWFWLPSSAGYAYASQRSQQFGTAGDVPIVR